MRHIPGSSAGFQNTYNFWKVCSGCTNTPKQESGVNLGYLASTANVNDLPLTPSVFAAV